MEATGVYWIPIFEILDARGFEVCLVNARHVKKVPGPQERCVATASGSGTCTSSACCAGAFGPRMTS